MSTMTFIVAQRFLELCRPPSCEFQRRPNIVRFQIRIIRKDLLPSPTVGQQSQNGTYGHSQPANARLPAHHLGVLGYASQDFHLPHHASTEPQLQELRLR
jgi:hypothetical protein